MGYHANPRGWKNRVQINDVFVKEVNVDFHRAHIYEYILNDGLYMGEKIVIQFSQDHPKWENGLFQTQYYEINEPVRIEWGHEGQVMIIELLN